MPWHPVPNARGHPFARCRPTTRATTNPLDASVVVPQQSLLNVPHAGAGRRVGSGAPTCALGMGFPRDWTGDYDKRGRLR
eukprot:gene35458-2636_t